MKQFFYVLLLINLTAQAQGIKQDPQSFSDKTLLAKLISEQADNGLAVVMDLSTNKIVSLSAFVRKGKSYRKDTTLLFSPIEPGSLQLPISASVLIDNFGVTIEDSVDLEGGKTMFQGLVVQDAEQHGIRNTSLLTVLAESSNVGIAKLVNTRVEGIQPTRLFKSMVLDYFNDMVPANFGFVSKSSLPFWAFGYGLTLTPNQIFSFYCRVANKDNTLFKNPNTFNQIQSALLEVCKNGTARRLFLDTKYNVAGKTGTSLALNKNGYTDAQYQASFIGYAPAENPKYACMVIIKCHKNAPNHFGASVAGPVFKDIMENVLKSVISNKFIQEPFEKVMAPDSIQILLSENMKYYHHLEDSISKLRRDAFERDSNYKEEIKSFTIDGKKYTGYDGGALGYYMKACWSQAQEIIKKFMPITRVAGCGNENDYNSQNRNVNYYNCELVQKNYTRSNTSEPIIKSKNYYIYFYDK